MECRKCGKEGEHYPGMTTHCKECHRAHLRTYYAANKAKYQARDEKYRRTALVKKQARAAVARAIKRGVLVPQPCEECGAPGQAHHPSYAPGEWLNVVWLCPTHHKRAHAKAA